MPFHKKFSSLTLDNSFGTLAYDDQGIEYKTYFKAASSFKSIKSCLRLKPVLFRFNLNFWPTQSHWNVSSLHIFWKPNLKEDYFDQTEFLSGQKWA